MVFAYGGGGFFDIVIKREALDKIREDLSFEFISEYQVDEGYFDGNLIIIPGGMSDGEANYTINELETKYGLVHIQDGVAQDMVCTFRGNVCSKCNWLKCGTLDREIFIGKEFYPKDFPFYEFVE